MQWCISVHWTDPSMGVTTYGPYDHPPRPGDIAAVSVDYRNMGVLPEDVEIRVMAMSTAPTRESALRQMEAAYSDFYEDGRVNGLLGVPSWNTDLHIIEAAIAQLRV